MRVAPDGCLSGLGTAPEWPQNVVFGIAAHRHFEPFQ
jgi:hypothetical protein